MTGLGWRPPSRRAGPPTGPRRRADPERGSGTVLALAVVAVVLVLAMALAALSQAQTARGQAQAAADLGALAGASAGRLGWDMCTTARRTVTRNGARLTSCVVEPGGVVQVATERAVALSGLLGAPATARARAGPATARTPNP